MALRVTTLLLLIASLVAGCAGSRKMVAKPSPENVEALAAAKEAAPADAPAIDPLTPGYELEAAEDWPAAVAFYGTVLREQPAHSIALHRLGVIATYREDYEAAANYYRRAMELDPRNPTLLADTGYFLILQKQYDTAAAMLEMAVTLDPENERAINNLATVRGLRGEIDAALVLFRRVNSPADALLNLASIHEQRGEWQLSLACYHEARSVDANVAIPEEVIEQVAAVRQGITETAPPDSVAEKLEEPAPADAPIMTTVAPPPPSHPLRAEPAPPLQDAVTDSAPASSETIADIGPVLENEAEFFPDDQVVAAQAGPTADALFTTEWDDELVEENTNEIAPVSAAREEAVAVRPRDVALNGCCPVALRDTSQVVDGSSEFCVDCDGVTYALSSAEAMQRFRLHPERYLPSAGGLDVISVRSGKMERGNLHFSTWFRNRLFLFASADHVDEFRSDPLRYVELD